MTKSNCYRGFERDKNNKTMIGDSYGLLIVVDRDGIDKHGAQTWVCKCVCGSLKVVRGYHLRRGDVLSCGCWASRDKIQDCTEYLTKMGYEVRKKHS